MKYFIVQCRFTGETQEYVVCEHHAFSMPSASDTCQVDDADPDCACDLCAAKQEAA